MKPGPCDYAIYRHLSGNGYDCIVVAPSMTPRQSGNRIKTDRRDAQMLTRLRQAGESTNIYVPALEDEAMRELTRAREDARAVERKATHLGIPSSSWVSLQRKDALE